MGDQQDNEYALPIENGVDHVEVSLEIMHELLCVLGDAWSEIDQLKARVKELPQAQQPAPPLPTPTSAVERTNGVIIIDDSRLMQKSLTRIITSLGFSVIGCADDGQSGADLVIRKNPKLIILDHYMPVMDGLACLSQIRLERPDVRVIVCTGEPTLRLSQMYLLFDVSAIISKPIQMDRFARAVRDCMSYDPESLMNIEMLLDI